MKKISEKFHLEALTIVPFTIIVAGTVLKGWLNFFKFQSMSIFAICLQHTTGKSFRIQ